MLKRILVALVAVMLMVGFNAVSFADEKKAGSEMKGEMKSEMKSGKKKDEAKKKEEATKKEETTKQ